ncbi:MAG: hypothetical protein HFK03_01150 [Clostridia bacterium]|jgi:hypothetical protein|nr:hypothetical protein [Clostridia bacterium]
MNNYEAEIKKARAEFAQTEGEHTEAFRSIDEEELTEEVKLILKDYFLGTVLQNDKSLLIKFLNGQKFKLTIERCG